MWKVTFTGDADLQRFGGGDVVVWIFKENGERFTTAHSK
jgi:hypothetical protein